MNFPSCGLMSSSTLGALFDLLTSRPMVIPFQLCEEGIQELDVVHILNKTLVRLIVILGDLYESNADKGGFDASWKSYQIELALEEVFYGHPLSPCDGQLSARIGYQHNT